MNVTPLMGLSESVDDFCRVRGLGDSVYDNPNYDWSGASVPGATGSPVTTTASGVPSFWDNVGTGIGNLFTTVLTQVGIPAANAAIKNAIQPKPPTGYQYNAQGSLVPLLPTSTTQLALQQAAQSSMTTPLIIGVAVLAGILLLKKR